MSFPDHSLRFVRTLRWLPLLLVVPVGWAAGAASEPAMPEPSVMEVFRRVFWSGAISSERLP